MARESFSERKGEGAAPEVFRKNWRLPSQECVCVCAWFLPPWTCASYTGVLMCSPLLCFHSGAWIPWTDFQKFLLASFIGLAPAQECSKLLLDDFDVSELTVRLQGTPTRLMKRCYFLWLNLPMEIIAPEEPLRKSNPEIAGASRITQHAGLSPNFSLINWVLCWGSSEVPGFQDLSQSN